MDWDLSMHRAWTTDRYREADQSRLARAARDTEPEPEPPDDAETPPRR